MGSKNNLLIENAGSSYIDVRHTAWQDLAYVTEDAGSAREILKTSVNGHTYMSLGTSVLQEDSTSCNFTADTQRCVIKTFLNMAQTGDIDACRQISALKAETSQLTPSAAKLLVV